MTNRLILILLSLSISLSGFTQSADPQPKFPSPEEFLNQIYRTVVDSTFDNYYLITGADTCRFVKYDYEEWTKYYLKEPIPFITMNELSEKAYLSRYPYYWKQPHLEKAICITPKKADSLLFPERYLPIDSSHHRRRPKKASSGIPPTSQGPQTLIFSFSLPQFTDDGHYAVIDLNVICGANCGIGLTCLYKHTSKGWSLIGRHTNWSSLSTSQQVQ